MGRSNLGLVPVANYFIILMTTITLLPVIMATKCSAIRMDNGPSIEPKRGAAAPVHSSSHDEPLKTFGVERLLEPPSSWWCPYQKECHDCGYFCKKFGCNDCCGDAVCIDNDCCQSLQYDCDDTDDCCGKGVCEDGRCCAPQKVEDACTVSGDCCSGVCCNGMCGPCLDKGCFCSITQECCTGECKLKNDGTELVCGG